MSGKRGSAGMAPGAGLGALFPKAPAAAPAEVPVSRTAEAGPGLRRGRLTSPAATAAERAVEELLEIAAPAGPVGDPESVARIGYFVELPVDSIRENPQQPRTYFDEEALEELVRSIQEVGLLQPIVVRSVGEGSYELIMGERRLRASKRAGKTTIPAIVRETEDEKLLLDALLENLHRSQLHPLEEASAYQQLLEEFGCTHEELAKKIGRSRSVITNTIRLLKLPQDVRDRIAASVLSVGHAMALLHLAKLTEGLDGKARAAMEAEVARQQSELAKKIVAEGLSVRTTEEITHASVPTVKRRRRNAPRAGTYTPMLNDLADRLGTRFDTTVKIALGKQKGKIVVEYATVDDLERILAMMAPGEGKLFAGRREADDAA